LYKDGNDEENKQELNSSETSCDRVGGVIGGVVKKPVSAWRKEVWLISKLQQPGIERCQKVLFQHSWIGQKIKIYKSKKLSKSCQTFRQT
jgi:hypothetical protein